jgi:hypothetical protein
MYLTVFIVFSIKGGPGLSRASQSAMGHANRQPIDLPESKSADLRCSDQVADDGAAAPTIAGADKGSPRSVALWA